MCVKLQERMTLRAQKSRRHRWRPATSGGFFMQCLKPSKMIIFHEKMCLQIVLFMAGRNWKVLPFSCLRRESRKHKTILQVESSLLNNQDTTHVTSPASWTGPLRKAPDLIITLLLYLNAVTTSSPNMDIIAMIIAALFSREIMSSALSSCAASESAQVVLAFFANTDY